eukprot:366262-Chlamydomonas_euryale.AAC.7
MAVLWPLEALHEAAAVHMCFILAYVRANRPPRALPGRRLKHGTKHNGQWWRAAAWLASRPMRPPQQLEAMAG